MTKINSKQWLFSHRSIMQSLQTGREAAQVLVSWPVLHDWEGSLNPPVCRNILDCSVLPLLRAVLLPLPAPALPCATIHHLPTILLSTVSSRGWGHRARTLTHSFPVLPQLNKDRAWRQTYFSHATFLRISVLNKVIKPIPEMSDWNCKSVLKRKNQFFNRVSSAPRGQFCFVISPVICRHMINSPSLSGMLWNLLTRAARLPHHAQVEALRQKTAGDRQVAFHAFAFISVSTVKQFNLQANKWCCSLIDSATFNLPGVLSKGTPCANST